MKIERRVGNGDMVQHIWDGQTNQMHFHMKNQVCTVNYADGGEVSIPIAFDVYNYQYGMPISNDGAYIFVGNWEWSKGLVAYHIPTETVAWKVKKGGFREIHVFPDYIVARKEGHGLFKVDIQTGELQTVIKGDFKSSFQLDKKTVIAFSDGTGTGKVYNVNTGELIKKYGSKVVNPDECLSYWVDNALLKDNQIIISARGMHRYKKPEINHKIYYYTHSIDLCFSNGNSVKSQ